TGLCVWDGLPKAGYPRIFGLFASASSTCLLVLAWVPVSAVGIAIDLVILWWLLTPAPTLARDPSAAPVPARRRLRSRVARVVRVGFVGYLALVLVTRPWHSQWGTTDQERRAPLPGDATVPDAHYRIDHAVTIKAPADSVWRWLVQIGQDRAGFYSYDWLERLVGADIHNADRIVPEWQHRAVGDLVRAVAADYLGGRLGREVGWRVSEIVPGQALVLDKWGAFAVLPVDSATSRLYVRLRGPGIPSLATIPLAPFGLFVFEPIHFIMERGMLLGIKTRAEAGMHPRI
ncbi:MAG: hypothetical protein ABI647_26980, partial [Gemmatimonadota bacterium]